MSPNDDGHVGRGPASTPDDGGCGALRWQHCDSVAEWRALLQGSDALYGIVAVLYCGSRVRMWAYGGVAVLLCGRVAV